MTTGPYITTDIPAGMTIAEYRRWRAAQADRKRRLVLKRRYDEMATTAMRLAGRSTR